jgi:ketosteroid isomerase-like protein
MKVGKFIQLSLAIAVLAAAQIGCTPENTNTATTNTNMAAPEATPDKAVIETELLRIENDWPRVIKERDVEAVRRLEADDIVLVYWDGSVGSKEQDIKDIGTGNLSADSITMSETKVNVIDKDAAVVSGLITITGAKLKTGSGTADISGNYRFIDTFARRDGQWKLVGSSSVKAPKGAAASASPKALPAATGSPATKASPAPKASPTRRPGPPPPPKPASTP